MKKEVELKVRISPEDKERIHCKMEEAGILNMSAYIRKMALDGICVRLEAPRLPAHSPASSTRSMAENWSATQTASTPNRIATFSHSRTHT